LFLDGIAGQLSPPLCSSQSSVSDGCTTDVRLKWRDEADLSHRSEFRIGLADSRTPCSPAAMKFGARHATWNASQKCPDGMRFVFDLADPLSVEAAFNAALTDAWLLRCF